MARTIGKTSSGKRVYDASHAAYRTRHKMPKWNIVPDALDEPKILKRTLRGWTRLDHEEAAELHEAMDAKLSARHRKLVDAAERKHGDHGSLISGGMRDHWPESVKEPIRKAAHTATAHSDAARAHRAAMRFRS